MKQIRMIGLDLDGTLLNTQKELTENTRRVLTEAIDSGILVLVATGRPFTGIPEELRTFPGIHYALTSNGARVLDTDHNKLLIEHLLPMESAKKALRIFEKYDTLSEIYFDGQGYADAAKLDEVGKYHHDPNMWNYVRTTRIPVPDIWDVIAKENRNMDKVQALFADMDEREQAWKELSELKELELVGSLSYNIEINATGVNKGTALVALGEMLGIPREAIMACGDGDNDVHLLREVGFGVAMANAQPQVKDAADYITSSNDEEGVARAIEKFALS
ncbi:Cof-type HAD-IIB family hydrolase [Blautia sp. CLA-JM-H16]|mgnify:FL=1|uniref:Cof-type HAD-IIB family hydrolase n=1 Tax=Blautia aquisgranensis TaxID=3133153 RepID=A0ABV1BHE5_9FIRM